MPKRLVRDVLSSVIVLLLAGACTRTTPSQAPVQPDASVPAANQPAPAPVTAAPQVPGPVAGTRITEAYARAAARDVYFWAWTLVNVYNRRINFQSLPGPGRLGGVLPASPLNSLSMLTDYVAPSQREVACPNQDVVYGGGPLGLDVEPVVIQVPDFGDRFWVYQVVDTRTDSFVDLGKMYGTTPGFYLLAGPGWKGETPKGITRVFRSSTNSGYVIPRVFLDATAEDRKAVQPLISQIDMYPLSKFDGKMKTRDWSKTPDFPAPPPQPDGSEAPKVDPKKFWDELPAALADTTPLPGEEAQYAKALSLVEAAKRDPTIKAAITDEAVRTEKELIAPLLEFRNFGIPVAANWSTVRNGAKFGTDYFTRTAVAKSNIFVNKPNEATYFYQDLDANGARLDGGKRYTVTFAKGGPPVKGFWSLTLYDAQHFFVPNTIDRYSLGTKNKDLVANADGTTTIYVQADAPADPSQRTNWLPSPKGKPFSLYMRTYWPDAAILDGTWSPPKVEPVQ
ncbi:DUF1254 domain-containing protein [Lysobacter niastensis]|uniref:DUF1254 domain-containing protein n=1 Tax=Lysobacter niastensis TaxID=380629 RepID=A0ABS0B5L8_9GAMM|nr:DUF1254 domain-containing protein [Lysobacter niastensis]MBF6023987.1 DUF1254 domain-containing protein [Lysobacter niastensis]